jgi:predicted Zn-dependent peptidase
LEEIVRGENLSEAELEEHKQSVINSIYSQYEPRFNFVKDEARFDYYGYPRNYLRIFSKNIEKLTLNDLRRAAKTYLRPDALKVLVVGDVKKMGVLPGAKIIDKEDI